MINHDFEIWYNKNREYPVIAYDIKYTCFEYSITDEIRALPTEIEVLVPDEEIRRFVPITSIQQQIADYVDRYIEEKVGWVVIHFKVRMKEIDGRYCI
jgi:hypothetical protein